MEENRIIKFKGKTQYDKTWVTGHLVVDNDTYYIYSKEKIYPNEKFRKSNGFYAYKVIPKTVGQYTGIKDKKGNEIYEKDIVKWGSSLLDVIYANCAFVARYLKNRDSNYLFDYTLSSLSDADLEVVDNICNNS